MYLYKVGTRPVVLIKQGVLISEVSLKRGFTILINPLFTQFYVGLACQKVCKQGRDDS